MDVKRFIDAGPEDRTAFASIYEVSFPAEERVEAGALLASIDRGERQAWTARSDERVVGIAVVLELDGVDLAMLEYLAVDPQRRSTGIGSSLLGAMRSDLRAARPDLVGVVFEVERPAGATGAEREQRVRRIAFYRANGAAPVDTAGAYRAPAFRGDGTVSFDLMVLPLGDAAPHVEGPRLRQCVAAMLRGSYDLDPDDPFIDNVIAQLP